jgi:UDP-N-acetylmuramate dehydrogenase
MDGNIYRQLCNILGEASVLVDEPMKRHTTFRIGGKADYFVCPDSAEKLRQILDLCREEGLPWFVLGNGSNLLVSDAGYRGVVIQIYKKYQEVSIEGDRIRAGAGILLSRLASLAGEAELTGLEFASGIPGTLGGAVFMNAGAYGGEMKDLVESVTLLDGQGQVQTLAGRDLQMGYRTSLVKEKGWIVLSAVLRLQKGEAGLIRQRMEELREARCSRQPLELPSAGSTFKRPEGYFAGKLIMDAGLRGFRVGGAMVSEKHCGFVVNAGDATAADVRKLMQQVQERVWEQFHVRLEPEVRFLGEF